MSWHAYIDSYNWNYTHNCNSMVNEVIEKLALDTERHEAFWGDDICWWKTLDGMSGTDGAKFLGVIVGALMEAPEKFKAMNPANGWGNYDSFLAVLTDMYRASCENLEEKWECNG